MSSRSVNRVRMLRTVSNPIRVFAARVTRIRVFAATPGGPQTLV